MIRTMALRLRSLFMRSRVEDELEAEFRFHLDRQIESLVERGMPLDEARAAARRAMGGVEQRKEECRDARRVSWIENGVRDLRHAARGLRRSPVFTGVAILSLSLGIGANTAIFQLLDAIRLRTLPVARPQELAEVSPAGGHRGMGLTNGFASEMTNPLWEQVRDRQEAFSGMFAWGATGFLIGRGAEARNVSGLWVSGELFSVLRVAPFRGRLIAAADDQRGCGPRDAVISYPFWRGYFGASDAAIGSTLTVFGKPIEVIGVTPPDFFGLEIGKQFDVALPICAAATWSGLALDQRHVWWLTVMGRLKPGWTLAHASEHLRAISPSVFEATEPLGYQASSREIYRKFQLTAQPAGSGVSRLRGIYERSLWLLFGITGLVLLIACANLANLMLARAAAHEREIAIRVAIGASRARVAMQLLSESVLLAGLGGLLGVGLALFLSRAVIAFLGTGDDLQLDVGLDWRILSFTAVVALLTCVGFGLAPAVKSSLVEPGMVVKSGGRGTTVGRERLLLRRVLVAGQVSVSLILLIVALLFVRSFRNLITLDTGFRRSGIVLGLFADLSGPPPPGDRRAAVLAAQVTLLDGIRSVPRVEAAAVSTQFPLNGGSWTQGVRVPGGIDADGEQRGSSKFTYISGDYFRTFEIPLVAGRDVNDFDTSGGRKVVVVSEAFVRRFFGTANALGRVVRTVAEPNYPEALYEVVGVVGDTKYANLRDEIPPIAYVPIAQHPNLTSLKGIVFRSSAPLTEVIPEVRRKVAAINPNLVMQFGMLETQIRDGLVRERLMAWLAGFFGVLAAALATIGLYGVIAYMVVSRRNEIGIRLALGASAGGIVVLILRETALLLTIGLAAGVLFSTIATRSAATLLFGLSPHDVPTFAAAALLLAATAGFAGFMPARRASKVDPMVALRCE
jgi:predicted permease